MSGFLADIDTGALAVAAEVLKHGHFMDWDDFRDAALAFVGLLYTALSPAEKAGCVDQTVLTYRVWEEDFLKGYRDRFEVTPRGISLRTTDRL